MATYIGEQKVDGGTLKYGATDPTTGTREELFVKDTPAPTPSVTPTGALEGEVVPAPERYSRLPSGVTEDAYQDARASQYQITDPNQAYNDYRTNAIQQMQARITGINQEYGKKLESELAAQAPVNKNAEGRVDALSSLMGLAGSSSAITRTNRAKQDSENINSGIRSRVNAEKMSALNAIYDRIDDGAAKAAEAALETNKANRKALLEAVAANANSQVQALASTLADTGRTFEDWKKSDGGAALRKIMEQTGQSEYQIRYAWNNAIPEDLRPTTHTSYIDDGKGGTIMRQIQFNPITKKVESNDYALAVPSSVFNGDVKPIEGKNGELFVRQADGTYVDVSPNAAFTRSQLGLEDELTRSQIAKNYADSTNTGTGTAPSSYKEWELAGGEAGTGKTYAEFLKSSGSGGTPKQYQYTAANYATRLDQAGQIISNLESQFTGTESYVGQILPNFLKSSDRQQLEQAQKNFLNAVLRRESGAVISDTEFKNGAQQYFPQPGDSAEVLAQKKANRDLVTRNFVNEAGPALADTAPDLLNRIMGESYGSQDGGGDEIDSFLDSFNSPLSMGVNGSDVSGIKDGSSVRNVIGQGIATGIQNGSSKWKYGFDFVLKGGKGAPVPAPFNGTVVFAGKNGGFGNQVKVRLSDGSEIWLSHLDGLNVKKGQKISRGMIIGKQGNTGALLSSSGKELTPQQRAQGRGTHIDITVKKSDGKYLTSKEVASLLQTRSS